MQQKIISLITKKLFRYKLKSFFLFLTKKKAFLTFLRFGRGTNPGKIVEMMIKSWNKSMPNEAKLQH